MIPSTTAIDPLSALARVSRGMVSRSSTAILRNCFHVGSRVYPGLFWLNADSATIERNKTKNIYQFIYLDTTEIFCKI